MLVLTVALVALTVSFVGAEGGLAITALPDQPGAAPLYRRDQTICDPVSSVFVCERGTCYWGDDGFVGCCSVSSCAPRTTCVEYAEYAEQSEEERCDHNTGGCVVCSRADAPYCATNTNVAMGHYGMYCNSERFVQTWDYEYSWPGLAPTTTAGEDEEEETEVSSPSRRASPTSEGVQTTETGDAETGTETVNQSQTQTPCCQPSNDNGDGDGDGEEEDGDGLNIGAIVGGAVGGGLFLLFLVGLAVYCCRRRRRERPLSSMTTSTTRPMAFATPQASPLVPQQSSPSTFQPSPTTPQHFAAHGRISVAGYSQAPPSYCTTTPPLDRPVSDGFGGPLMAEPVAPYFQSQGPHELDGQGRWIPRHELEGQQTYRRMPAYEMAGREPRGPQY